MDYVRVTSESDLAEALQQDGAAVLAGGTDLLVKMRAGVTRPKLLVDISRVASLRELRPSKGGLVVGASTPVADLVASAALCNPYPLLASALRALGSVQIRARASLGGNLVNASPAADSSVALLAYDASVVLASSRATRALALDQFLRGPGRTALDPGEYVQSIVLPEPRPDWISFFHKVGRRQAMTIAIASVGGLLSVRKGEVVDVRLAAGSVAPTAIRLHAVERVLARRRLDAAQIEAAHRAAAAEVAPIDDVRASAAYRRDVIAELVARFLSQAL